MADEITECPECESGMLVKFESGAGTNGGVVEIVFGAYREKQILKCTECDNSLEGYSL